MMSISPPTSPAPGLTPEQIAVLVRLAEHPERIMVVERFADHYLAGRKVMVAAIKMTAALGAAAMFLATFLYFAENAAKDWPWGSAK